MTTDDKEDQPDHAQDWRKRAKLLGNECRQKALAHHIAYAFWVSIEQTTSILAAVLSGLVALKLFSDAGEGTAAWKWAVAGSAIATLCSLLSTFVATKKLVQQHETASKKFSVLAHRYHDLPTKVELEGSGADIGKKWESLSGDHHAATEEVLPAGFLADRLAKRRLRRAGSAP